MKRLIYYLLGTLLILSVSSGYGQSLKDYLYAYWSFDDNTANDHSGNARHGTMVNSPTFITGINGLGKAIHFIGKNTDVPDGNNPSLIGDHVLLPNINFTSLPNFTITMWVYEESFSYVFGEGYITFGNHTTGWLGIMNLCQQVPVLDTNITTTRYSISSTQGNPNGPDVNPIFAPFTFDFRHQWMFYCLVYSNGTMYAYRNGILQGSLAQPEVLLEQNSALARHWWYYGGKRTSARFTGAMDEVMIFSKALTVEEVDTLYDDPFLKLKTLSIYSDKNNICQGDTVVLTANGGFTSFLWNTGATTQSIVVNQSGTYSVVAKDEHNNEYYSEYNVSVIPVNLEITYINDVTRIIDFGNVYTYEQKQEVFRVTNIGYDPYPLSGISLVFHDKFTIPQYQLQGYLYPGDYKDITVIFNSNQAGIYSDTVYIPTSCNIYKITLRAQCNNIENTFRILICDGDNMVLDAGPGYIYYYWSTGAATETITVNQAGLYTVLTKDANNNEFRTGYDVSIMPPNLEISYVDDMQKVITYDTVLVGEQKTQSIKIKNIGNAPYPLSKLSLIFNNEFDIPDYILNFTLNPGETRYITAIFKPDKPGKFTDTVVIPMDCKNYKILLTGISKENQLSIKASTTTICDGDTLVLNATPGFPSYLWNTGESTQSIIVDKGGMYNVTATDQYGQQYHAEYEVNIIENSLDISYPGSDSSIVDVGDVKIGESGNGTIKIKNKSNEPVSLSNLLIDYKKYFNISQSQLDTILMPGESIDIVITFIPDSTGLFADTLNISDKCKNYIIALKGNGYDKILMKLDIMASRDSICFGDTVLLNATPGFISYLWNTVETTQSIIINVGGSYSVKTIDQYGQEYHADYSVNIIENNFEISYSGSDTSTLNAGDVKIGESGTGTINIKNKGTDPVSLSSLLIFYKIYFNISQAQLDTILLPGQSIDLVITFIPDSTGKFSDTLLIKDNCTDYSISLTGTGYIMKLDISSTSNATCPGDTVILSASPGFTSYLWNTGETTQSIVVVEGGMYSVTAKDQYGVEYRKEYQINTIENNFEITYAGSDQKTVDIGDVKIGESGTGTINLKNTGTDPVSLSSLLIYYKIYFNIPQSQLDKILMTGESIDVVITFIPNSSGSYNDTLFIRDNCKDYIIKLMGKGYAMPLMDLGITATGNSICQGDTIVLNASAGFSAYLWNTGETTQSITVNNSGWYNVKTTDQYGQEYHAKFEVNVLPVLFDVSYKGIDSTLLDFGNVYYGTLECRNVTIKNICNQPVSLKNINLYNNISISIPQSQLNQILNPGELVELEICFLPLNIGKFTDTLKIADNCSDHIIPIAGIGLGNTYLGDSKCHTAIKLGQTTGEENTSINLDDPYPNPANNIINIPFTSDKDISDLRLDCDLYTIYGAKCQPVSSQISNLDTSSGILMISTKDLTNGLYLLMVKNEYRIIKTIKIQINK